MSDEKIGQYHFTDSDGLPRYWGRTCNLYGSADDAEKAMRRVWGSRFRGGVIWKTRDGLFDFTITDDADQMIPELHRAAIVRRVS
jgi:hypothetical protein